jgi:hypothetical protein
VLWCLFGIAVPATSKLDSARRRVPELLRPNTLGYSKVSGTPQG